MSEWEVKWYSEAGRRDFAKSRASQERAVWVQWYGRRFAEPAGTAGVAVVPGLGTRKAMASTAVSLAHFRCRKHYAPFLLLLSFASGAVDVFSIPALHIFVANNTGNLIFLALAAAQLSAVDPGAIYPISAIIALAGSWLGSLASSFAGRTLGKSQRRYVFADLLLQSILMFIVCGLYWGHVIAFHDGRTEYIAVSLLPVEGY
ncbi:hypothetical protein BCV69DRAFT_278287 [Microstroma glucosiphilum]|uniref:DUF1275-domain-containing protein n=1 Tax=Pseudomicrostroma glucosiphilum TaxID=1684307 RepID=A0A316U2R4_9BASI|nr:hypothetical protein BCV69DRAFT_278287 [Pseudomicrostroma glucosiphilum]PWN19602.1 hypothetical protein BCV69DRAFT_278287 [Pseudomicrostroma glucosiphilum]